jgi:hypothetical protein
MPLGQSVATATPASVRSWTARTRMSAPADSLTSTSKGNKMYLVMSNENVLASCETHDMAFMFFEAFGGFSYPNLTIEIERED